MQKILVIQTAFIGDVILATSVIEKLHAFYPQARIDILVRKGNEDLLRDHPFLNNILLWNKKEQKNRNLLRMIGRVRSERYDALINLHRFATSGLISFLSAAKFKAGFDKNPFSFCYDHKVKHIISEPYSENPVHEVMRNHSVIRTITDEQFSFPALYPNSADLALVADYKQKPYICIAPSSVWFTKQFAEEKWIALINELPAGHNIFLLGAPGDSSLAERIKTASQNSDRITNLSGKFSLLQSAALMRDATMNYVNDSGPLHICTAMNAPVTAVFCSTVPAFGFGPIRENGKVVEIRERLYCRPCGLHGHKACPQGHFRCAMEIENEQLLWWISKTT